MDSRLFLIINNQQSYDCCGLIGVSGLNATDKTPMNDNAYDLYGWGLGLEIACISFFLIFKFPA